MLTNSLKLVLGVVFLSACASNSPAASTPAGSDIPSASASAAASARPDLTGRVVFLRPGRDFGDGTVFTANADGSNEQRLSETGGACCVWATRDGERVQFSTAAPDGRITVATVNFDGSDRFVVPLPEGTLNLGPGPFSPDGTQIAFGGFDDPDAPQSHGIYIGSADGTNLVQITHGIDIPGDWSPDGTQLVFLREPDGDALRSDGLFVVNVDGSGEHRLTPADMVVACCWGFRWSPDGSRILFADENGVLWLINPDGSDLKELFVDAKVEHVRRHAITPTWSPDGTQIMFGLSPTRSPIDPPTSPYDDLPNGLYVIDADGTGLTVAIGDPSFKQEPYWVP
jgi:Tol biopolymer transport system component